ncbi:tRNA pseudouridine(13) synthase TruD [Candidatus Nitrospira bockiana]
MTERGESRLPYLTDEIPGIGGTARAEPEDFEVEEQPLYLPCGQGEHLYLRVKKRGLGTPQMVAHLASVFGVKARCIGVAGLKDARAVTTQMVSVQGIEPDIVARATRDPRILAVEVLGRHRNRLRTGHHAGNRFRLTLHEVSRDAASVTPLILAELGRRGVPNYFGPQRQGRHGVNYETGAALLRDPTRRNRMPRRERLWFLHAYQSFLFNQMLAARLTRLDRMLTGDWAIKHANGACFHVEDGDKEQPRADAFEISPTALLFGSRAPWASGEPGDIERAVVQACGETPESLREAAARCGFRGERRALRLKADDLHWSLEARVLRVSFTLPPGGYATNVLRELMKTEEIDGKRR